MKNIFTKKELNTIDWLLLDLSQDIRFAAEFRLKNHKILKKHLLETHKNILKIKNILELIKKQRGNDESSK